MSRNTRPIGLTIFICATVALVLVVVSLLAGRLSAPREAAPETGSPEAGFARDMQVHHDQAVEMALLIRDRTEDEEVRLLAYDIATTQAQQSGQMFGWLATWGLSQASPTPVMAWMEQPVVGESPGHQHAGGAAAIAEGDEVGDMPGLATREQIEALRASLGVEAERQFLELMIDHHLGGVHMAEAIEMRSELPVVTDFAASIILSQNAEIGLMEDLLAARQS